MIRKAFKMKIHIDKIREYTKRHNPIWKELYDVLKASGVHNYSIYFDPQTNYLFGYAEIESEQKWSAISNTEICKKWWKYMKEIMETNRDNSPVSVELIEVFHID